MRRLGTSTISCSTCSMRPRRACRPSGTNCCPCTSPPMRSCRRHSPITLNATSSAPPWRPTCSRCVPRMRACRRTWRRSSAAAAGNSPDRFATPCVSCVDKASIVQWYPSHPCHWWNRRCLPCRGSRPNHGLQTKRLCCNDRMRNCAPSWPRSSMKRSPTTLPGASITTGCRFPDRTPRRPRTSPRRIRGTCVGAGAGREGRQPVTTAADAGRFHRRSRLQPAAIHAGVHRCAALA